MKSVMSRIGCFFLAFILLLTGVFSGAVPAKAAYENTYKNTGDQRADLIGVALTQVGYREGSNNYTKYGVWYGAPNTAWCGMFVSWCANQAGISTSIIRKNGFANAAAFGLTDTYKASQRTPKPGDLLFKNNNSHVGIVYYVSGDYVYTIEGNTSTTSSTGVAVMIRKRALSGSYYFAAPKYTSDGSHNYVKGNETAHPHKEYFKCTDCGSQYYTGNTATVNDCKECIMANCSHNYNVYKKLNTTYHTAVCSKCGKETKLKHDWDDDEVVREPTCQKTGLVNQFCTLCNDTRQASIPKTEDHQYTEWEYVDGKQHVRSCESCKKEFKEEHTVADWQYDSKEHWHTCADCGGRADTAAHTLKKGCDSTCPVCKYDAGGHIYSTVLSSDEKSHWYGCIYCTAKIETANHIFSADCDPSCNDCGYIRDVQHTYSDVLTYNEIGHFYACTICAEPQQIIPHHGGDAATEELPQKCTECGFEIMPRLAHQHTFAPYTSNSSTHWGTCGCGYSMEAEIHTWDITTGKCTICGAEPPVIEEMEIPWLIVLPAVAGGAILLALLIGLLVLRKRRKAKAALQKKLEETEAVPV